MPEPQPRGSTESSDPSSDPDLSPSLGVPSLPRRILLVVVAPGELFQRLRSEPAVLGALFVGAGLVGLANLLIPMEIWEAAVREQLVAAGQEMPDDMGTVATIGKVAAVVGAFVAWPLFALGAAGVFLLLFVFGMGYEGSYRQYLAVVAHALLVPALGALVLVPLRILTGDPQFALTLALVLPEMEEGFLRNFFELQDLFNLWAYVLIGIGAAAMAARPRSGDAVAAALGLALLLSALFAALSL